MFKTMFSLPPGSESVADGTTDDTPIRLDGIKKADFEQLLRVLYPGLVESNCAK